jgi:predicted RNase H-like HicB family nuclease
MKIIVKKEHDGKNYIGSCENLPNCYCQTSDPDQLLPALRAAIEMYRKSYEIKNQALPDKSDSPVIDRKIRFNKISSLQLSSFLQRFHYHVEQKNNDLILFVNSLFPFNRIILPVADDISPIILTKLFGKENIIYINKSNLKMNSSA